ncbi:hypothetical protein K2X14_17100 [Acetobacter sp. TBRC 12305]|uniref:HTH psq-type domain-containing protein n=1 Tax=Acetobacter garciniae TaxID=2817435 RepID=A0A939KRG2_9PROT|nr:hypothetical protein [Acetobacter garciniae]MBX0346545.1 hypothetical protein [Acetobacter garciniae]
MLSQRQAAQTWGISRSTLQRAISKGNLSVSGSGKIDPSEMLRVFGAARSGPTGGPHGPPVGPLGPGVGHPQSHGQEPALEAENKALRAALAAKEELIAAKDRHIEDLSQALRLLAAPSQPSAPPEPEPPATPEPPARSIWQRLFGL